MDRSGRVWSRINWLRTCSGQLENKKNLGKLGKFKNILEILEIYGIISLLRRCSSSVEHQLPKLGRRVRFPSSALTKTRSTISRCFWFFIAQAMKFFQIFLAFLKISDIIIHMGTWLSWESAAFATQRSRVRISLSPFFVPKIFTGFVRNYLASNPILCYNSAMGSSARPHSFYTGI